MNHPSVLTVLCLPFLLLLGACGGGSGDDVDEPPATRMYRLGFSAAPPRLDAASALRTVDHWSSRADIALMPVEIPWAALLAGEDVEALVTRDHAPLAGIYRKRGLPVVAVMEPADGLDRTAEAAALRVAGRSVAEAAVQDHYRAYVLAFDRIIGPDWLGLAVETNLLRMQAPTLYAALVEMTGTTASALRAAGSGARLFVSVQVDTAWGLLGAPVAATRMRTPSRWRAALGCLAAGAPSASAAESDRFVGVARDRADFPFIDALGLSTYPAMAGFAAPEDVPIDYFSRLVPAGDLPLLMTEGGWPSTSSALWASDQETQARWIVRLARIADAARLTAVMQITYTDLDMSSYTDPNGVLAYFATLGLVTTDLTAKPALARWDALFARRLSR